MAVNEIIYRGVTYDRLAGGSCYLSTSLPCLSLEANTLTVTIKSADKTLSDFERNTPVVYRHAGKQVGVFYVQSVKRVAPELYEFSCTSQLGVLAGIQHNGGVYDGTLAGDLIDDICGTIPHVVKSAVASLPVYGWLPIGSARDNLARALYAVGATVQTDLDGVIHINGLWPGVSGAQETLCMGAAVEYADKVTKVIVAEHQYSADKSEQEAVLFEGSAQDGDKITFYEPVHSLRAEGFGVKYSEANFAILTAGAGKLYGKPYRHTTRDVEKEVAIAGEQKSKVFDDATLVSIINAVSVADHMAAFYKCTRTIDADAYYHGEQPGDRVTTIDPFDGIEVDAVVQSVDLTMSAILKAHERLLVGYVPPVIGDLFYDVREVIDTDKVWTVPDGVSTLTAAVIGGGAGGTAGGKGEDAAAPEIIRNDSAGTSGIPKTFNGVYKGGAKGTAGAGGKVNLVSLDVTPGQTFAISVGKGGKGQAYGSAAPATAGTSTAFGPHSSEDGTASEQGYFDPVTGEKYAAFGPPGYAGNDGTGLAASDTPQIIIPPAIVIDGTEYANGAQGERLTFENQYLEMDAAGSLGGGAAYKTPGGAGKKGKADMNGARNGTMRIPSGGDGATPAAYAKPDAYGTGGGGGHGGGGAGFYGRPAVITKLGSKSVTIKADSTLPLAKGGLGSDGGDGGDGAVILYYGVKKSAGGGGFLTKDSKFFVDKNHRFFIC